MKIVKPQVSRIVQEPGIIGMFKHIEYCARKCYKSEDLITDTSYEKIINVLKSSAHGSVFEHGAVYLQIPTYQNSAIQRYKLNSYSKVNEKDAHTSGWVYVSTNYRVILQGGYQNWFEAVDNNYNKSYEEDFNKYRCERTSDHEELITMEFHTQIAISRELNRSRSNSPSEQSTRYCNYTRGKFGSEISINEPNIISETNNQYENMCIDELLDYRGTLNPLLYWTLANKMSEYCYSKLIECGWKTDNARTVLPLDTHTELVHTTFKSSWEYFLRLRMGKDVHIDARNLAFEVDNLIC